jgi:multidrug transporter EmrE-like cation transporter
VNAVPLNYVLLFTAAMGSQIVSIGLLPRTHAFTNAIPTLLCITGFVLSLWMLSRLTQSGVNLSILVPLTSTVAPLASILIGILLYGEAASAVKIALLIAACGLVGVASKMA